MTTRSLMRGVCALLLVLLGSVISVQASGPIFSAYALIQNAGANVARRTTLNFVSGITCVDNAGAGRTDCTGSGGGGATISAGTFASLPAASTAGNMYLFTDSGYQFARDTGTAWQYFRQGYQLTPPTGFSWQNQSTATLTTTAGGELIKSAVGAAGSNWNCRYVAYPAAPFTRTLAALVTGLVNSTGNQPGNATTGIYISDGSNVEQFLLYGANPQTIGVQFGTSPTNITTNVVVPFTAPVPPRGSLMWFRIDDGVTAANTRTWSYSYDGTLFQQFFQEGNTANLTPTRIGYCAGAFEVNTFSELWALGWQ